MYLNRRSFLLGPVCDRGMSTRRLQYAWGGRGGQAGGIMIGRFDNDLMRADPVQFCRTCLRPGRLQIALNAERRGIYWVRRGQSRPGRVAPTCKAGPPFGFWPVRPEISGGVLGLVAIAKRGKKPPLIFIISRTKVVWGAWRGRLR